jgi:membrane-associated phospholipid phosphatase
MSTMPAWTDVAARAGREARALDAALYAAVAATPTPTLDAALRRLSALADRSGLWLAIAAMLAATGGARGRRAAVTGLLGIGAASVLTNVGLKLVGRRRRPDRAAAGVPLGRHVPMPRSTSFPSGHAASAFAFAAAVGHALPAAGGPLRLLAATVAYSRVHTGVHYPADVVVGALVGASAGAAVAATTPSP